MAKLAVLLATFALVLFLANASIHTTVTVDNEGENPWGRQEGSCQQQIMQQNYLKHCQKYMKERCSGGSCDNQPGSRHLDFCCQQLEKLDGQCRCPGLKQALQQQMEGRTGREQMQEMQQMAEEIMSKCDMEPRRCAVPRSTITLDNEENPRGTQECTQQIQKQNYLKHCQRYMDEQCSCGGCDNRPGSRHLDSCCEQLEQLDRPCRCPGLEQAMEQQMGQGQIGREEKQKMRRMVQKIMSKCDVEPRRCDMPSRGWF